MPYNVTIIIQEGRKATQSPKVKDMKRNEILDEMMDKNTIFIGDYSEWSLYSPDDTNYAFPCYFKGCNEYYNLKDLRGEYEIVTWVNGENPQEVNGVIYYFQIPVLIEVKVFKEKIIVE